MDKKLLWGLAGAMLVAGTAAHAAQPQPGQWSLSGGFDYSSGKYGQDTSTDIWSVPLGFGYTGDRWTAKVSVPYIHVSGPSDVIPGVGRVENLNPLGRGRGRASGSGSTPSGTVVTRGSASGIGDVVASAGFAVVQSDDRSFGVDLTGKVKFGTADQDKGLGTGKNDYGLSLGIHKDYGDWTTFGSVGWTHFGSSSFIRLDNGMNASLGAGYLVGEHDSIGASYFYQEKVTVGGGPQSELTAYWNHRLSDGLRMQVYVLGGFADGSPDYGAGAALRYLF